MANRSSTKNKTTLQGTNAADTLTVKHQQITVTAGKAKDKINVISGSKHNIYGEAGNDVITIGAKVSSGSKIYGDDAKNKLTGKDIFNIDGGKKNTFYGGKGADTFNINGGSGNILDGGVGNDVFVIGKNSTGTATVKNFSVSKGNTDTVKVTGGAVKSIAVSGKNMIVKGGTSAFLTLQNAKSKTFTVTDTLGTYTVSGAYVKLAVGKNYKGTLTAGSFVTTVDARNDANAVTIKGNTKNNTIYGGAGANTIYGNSGDDTLNGGAGNDTLYGGVGNDTLTGGAGNDTFVYANGDGNDTIKDYAVGQDTLQISSGSISKTALANSNKDLVFTVGTGKITLSNAATMAISLKDSRGNYTASNTAITLGSDFTGTMNAGNYLASVKAIDGRKVTKAANITGNAQNNTIYAGQAGGTIDGGAGNDTLYGGVGTDKLTGGAGNDTFVYANGDGNDTVTDYAEGQDKLQISNGTISKTSLVNNNKDLVFTVGNGTVILSGAATKAISLKDSRGSYTVSNTAITLGSDFTGTMDAGNYLASVKTIDGQNATKAVNITGNDQANTIYAGKSGGTVDGGAGNDKIYGGTGNDTLTGGAGSDTFVYASGGGNDTITDYEAGQDTVEITGGSVSGTSLSGADVVFTVGSGTVTVENGSGKAISIEDSRGSYTASNTAITLGSEFTGTLDAGAYLSTVTTVDGSAAEDAVNVIGNAQANTIYAGKSGGTVDGGAGNDKIYGGAGSDTFVYVDGGGNDTITDYEAGQDTVEITGGSVSGTWISGTDVVFTVGSGSVTVENGSGKAISIEDSRGSYTASNTAITLGSEFTGTIDAGAYLSTVTTIDGSAAEDAVNVIGNAQANTIYAGKSGGTVDGGSGNDTIYGGAGNDTFVYSGGQDTIYDYSGADTIRLASTTLTRSTVSGNDVILDLANDGKITVKDAKGTNIRLVDSEGKEQTINNSGSGTTYDNVVSGSEGEDTFTYSGGSGNIIIKGYEAGQDTVEITGGSVSGTSLSGADVVFTVGSGSVTVENGSGKAISIEDSRGSYTVSNATITLGSDFTGTMDAGAYLSTVTTIDGSAAEDAVNIIGNAQANTIYAGKSGGTVDGGAGNDTLYGGAVDDILYGGADNDTLTGGFGNDTFVYGSGIDNITDYTNNAYETDTLRIEGTAAISNVGYSDSNNTFVLFMDNDGKIRLSDALGKPVRIEDNHGIYTVTYLSSNSTITIGDDFSDSSSSFDASDLTFAKVIDASGMTKNITITGNTSSNVMHAGQQGSTLYGGEGYDELHGNVGNDILYGGAGYDTLEGGDGNDILYGGADGDTLTGGLGNDIFVYDSGFDVITDYTNNENETDIVRIEGKTISNVGYLKDDNSTFVLLMNNGDQITLTDAVGKPVRIEDNHGIYTVTYLLSDSTSTSTITIGDDFSDSSSSFDVSDLTFAKVIDASGMTKNITITGNTSSNVMHAGQQGSTLYGGAGYDTLEGGDGNDILYGGANGDTLTGGLGNDIFVYDSGIDVITDYTNNENETDTLRIEDTTISNVWESASAGKLLVDTANGGQVQLTGAIGKSVRIEDNHGIYTVTCLPSNSTITLDDGFNGSIFDASDLTFAKTIDASAMEDSITVTGNTKDNVIYAGKAGGVITGGTGSDTFICSTGHNTITDYANNAEEKDVLRIEGSSVGSATVENGSDVRLAFVGGSVTLNGVVDRVVKVEDASGNYSISNLNTTPTITFGSDYAGSAFDANSLAFIQTIDAADMTQAITITGNTNNNVIYAGGRYSDVLAGGTGSDTYVISKKMATDAALTINQGDYSPGDTDILQFQKINKEDVRYSLQDNVLTIMHSSGGTISVTDWDTNPLTSIIFADGSISNAEINACLPSHSAQPVTQQSVIKSFMRSLDDSTKIVGTTNSVRSALDVALTFASNFAYTSWDNLVKAFKNDITTHAKMEEGHQSDWITLPNGDEIVEPGIDSFLRNYCGITLLNDDTGSITGLDAGGSTKTAESVINEEGTLNNMITATPGGTTTINGLTFHWPEVDSAAQQKMINAINTWWAKEGLDLIEESYGMSFNEEDASAYDIEVKFVKDNNSLLAYVAYESDNEGVNTNLSLNINMKYYNDILDENGKSDGDEVSEYLDRTIAHELTHAVMAANITGFANLPKYIKEGSAELVHGIDDVRTGTILSLTNLGIGTVTYTDDEGEHVVDLTAQRTQRLEDALTLDGTSDDTYSAGYMLLRYFAKKVADYWAGASGSQSDGMLASSVTYSGENLVNLASINTAMIDFTDNTISDAVSGIQKEESQTNSLFITGNI